MAVVEDPSSSTDLCMIDEAYEFSAPKFFDFIIGETEEEMCKAELWFESNCSYAPSPFMPRIKTGRSVQLDCICDFSEGEQLQKASDSSAESTATCNIANKPTTELEKQTRPQDGEVTTAEVKNVTPNELKEESTTSLITPELDEKTSSIQVKAEVCTPAPPTNYGRNKDKSLQTDSKKHQTAKKIASVLRNPSALKSKYQSQQSQAKSTKPEASVRRDTNVKSTAETPKLAQENQAIKRQKLEGGKFKQILNVKPQTLPHKARPGLIISSSNWCSSTTKTRKEDRKVYVREPAAPFVSMAEMIKKFQSNTRQMSLPHMSSSLSHDDAVKMMHRKAKLILTRPKEPEFETAQRVRPFRVKSSAELEEEMMAKIPKFKARPLNRKILEAPTLSTVPRSTPQPPEFKEFHLETMSRANQLAETSSVAASIESSQSLLWKPHLTAPKPPLLQTLLRARPPKIKSSEELEKEELEKIPKFKARPLNKKIFESKGDLGMFCNKKRPVTIPQEFHFAIDERIPPPPNVADMFDKLSINLEHQQDKPLPRNTNPHPFHLNTEERGAEKERKLLTELLQKQLEEERIRIPKAKPYPYTTDYPVIPPKPEPKPCTKPEPFELESLVRHAEEIQRDMEERLQKEIEEAQMRIFKAQPILKEDPIPIPEKARKPLTEVQEFNLQIHHRAVDRSEFDKKVKEKEMMHKRYREEAESARQMEEEKALKQLRRTLVPHARPVPSFEHSFLPQKSSKQVTKPKSPRLNILKRQEKRRIVVCPVATGSSSATQMR